MNRNRECVEKAFDVLERWNEDSIDDVSALIALQNVLNEWQSEPAEMERQNAD